MYFYTSIKIEFICVRNNVCKVAKSIIENLFYFINVIIYFAAINSVIKEKGGVSCVNKTETKILALPVAGLMSNADPYEVAKQYTIIDAMSKALGSQLGSPFMTLSFMALLVIPHLKLSDKGLFDGDQFKLF